MSNFFQFHCYASAKKAEYLNQRLAQAPSI